MTVLPPPEKKAVAVRDMFDRIAPRYDLVNRVMTGAFDQRWRRRLVDRLEVGPGDTVLDLACGTGDFLEIARERTHHVWGIDLSRGMLEGAVDRGLDDVPLVQGDALRMPFPEGAFTVAMSGFALRNFTAIPPVLAELARVLRPGGRLGFLEVDRPKNAIARAGHRFYIERVVPLIGGLLSGDMGAYRYLPASTAYLPSTREMAAMLRTAGFGELRKVRAMGGAIQSITAVRL
jgi:demethylmenaquinone methyltransferase/2-methoxy-6-polyprenyl-1,4-benzoquinol methylase